MGKEFNRDTGIDILRIIATLMIVLAHVVVVIYERQDFYNGGAWFASFFTITLARLGVPLFFIISGYLLLQKQRTLYENLKHTFKRLYVPFMIWTLLTYLGLYYTNNLPKFSLELLVSGGGTEYYFLIGLIVIYLLNPYMSRFTHSTSAGKLQLVLVVLGISTVIQAASSYAYGIPDINIFNYWFLGLFYFVYGQYYRLYPGNKLLSVRMGLVLFALPLLVNMILIYLARMSGNTDDLYLESYYGPTVLISSIGFFNIIKGIEYGWVKNRIKKMLTTLSLMSFGVFLVHGIVLDLILHKTRINPYGEVRISLWVFLILAVTLTISISGAISYLLSRNKIGKIMLGQ